MVRKWIYCLPTMMMALVFFSNPQGWAQSQSGSNVPVITNAFVVGKVSYGDILRVYIEVEDPNGDMFRIATSIDQPGYGHYPTSWVYIKPMGRKHLKGYLQWNTFSNMSSRLSEWTQITLTVSVFDKVGNESNVFAFPITFETGVKRASAYKLAPPFDQNDLPRLGFIHIDLIDPTTKSPGN